MSAPDATAEPSRTGLSAGREGDFRRNAIYRSQVSLLKCSVPRGRGHCECLSDVAGSAPFLCQHWSEHEMDTAVLALLWEAEAERPPVSVVTESPDAGAPGHAAPSTRLAKP